MCMFFNLGHTHPGVDTLRETRPLMTFDFGKRAIKVCKCDGKVMHLYNIYLSKTFSRSLKVTLPNIRKVLVR